MAQRQRSLVFDNRSGRNQSRAGRVTPSGEERAVVARRSFLRPVWRCAKLRSDITELCANTAQTHQTAVAGGVATQGGLVMTVGFYRSKGPKIRCPVERW